MEKEIKDNKKNIFFFGIVVFAIGVLLTYFGYEVGSPISPYATAQNTYLFPFLTWITLAGIAIAVVGYWIGRKKRNGKED